MSTSADSSVPETGFTYARLSRRAFLVGSGGVAIGVVFGGLGAAREAAAQMVAYAPNAWVKVARDGIVTIYAPAAEMGQGVMTSLPLLVAEDMDLAWNRVRIEQAGADAASYGNPLFGGRLLTAGSRSVQGYYEVLRMAGLQARLALMQAAAARWQVPVAELDTEPHTVLHRPSGRKLDYGAIASFAEAPAVAPQANAAQLKFASQFRLIGKDVPRVDLDDKLTGRAVFGIDVRQPQMLYATVLRGPIAGERLAKLDDSAARKVPGVRAVMQLPYGVAIVAETYWGARKARAALRGQWTTGGRARGYSSAKVLADYRARARDLADPGVEVERIGDPAAAFGAAAKTVSADYGAEHVAHMCMEPMNCTALVVGERIEVWASTQSASATVDAVVRTTGFKRENVVCHVTLLGGGLGRRIETDFVVDAATLAQALPGRAIKVIWTREDDVQHDKYRPLVAQHLSAALDAAGGIVALRHRVVAESITARVSPATFEQAGGRDDAVTGGASGLKYAIANRAVHYLREQRGLDVGYWRGLGAGYTKFALETFIDQLAAAARRDPVEYRLALLADEPRARAVIEEVARRAGWGGKRRSGRALGIAYSDACNSHVAQVAEVSIDHSAGRIWVHEVWCVIDCGLALQPANVAAQVESGIVQGLSQALYERITIRNGRTLQSNFHNYAVLRINEVPRIDVHVLPSDRAPGGVGEAGLPPTAPAVANAVAALTGRRLRRLPLEQHLLKTT